MLDLLRLAGLIPVFALLSSTGCRSYLDMLRADCTPADPGGCLKLAEALPEYGSEGAVEGRAIFDRLMAESERACATRGPEGALDDCEFVATSLVADEVVLGRTWVRQPKSGGLFRPLDAKRGIAVFEAICASPVPKSSEGSATWAGACAFLGRAHTLGIQGASDPEKARAFNEKACSVEKCDPSAARPSWGADPHLQFRVELMPKRLAEAESLMVGGQTEAAWSRLLLLQEMVPPDHLDLFHLELRNVVSTEAAREKSAKGELAALELAIARSRAADPSHPCNWTECNGYLQGPVDALRKDAEKAVLQRLADPNLLSGARAFEMVLLSRLRGDKKGAAEATDLAIASTWPIYTFEMTTPDCAFVANELKARAAVPKGNAPRISVVLDVKKCDRTSASRDSTIQQTETITKKVDVTAPGSAGVKTCEYSTTPPYTRCVTTGATGPSRTTEDRQVTVTRNETYVHVEYHLDLEGTARMRWSGADVGDPVPVRAKVDQKGMATPDGFRGDYDPQSYEENLFRSVIAALDKQSTPTLVGGATETVRAARATTPAQLDLALHGLVQLEMLGVAGASEAKASVAAQLGIAPSLLDTLLAALRPAQP